MPTIEEILGDPAPFLVRLFAALRKDGIDVDKYEMDHICYRVETNTRYLELRGTLGAQGTLLSEKEIAGRPIATFELHQPLRYEDREISCLELPAPKDGSPHAEGFEHAEFVIPHDFETFQRMHPHISFRKSRMKSVNPELMIAYEGFAVKFHQNSLKYVITHLE